MDNKRMTGHLAALFTILIWGTTFISTKILLEDFLPVEILFFRFVMGYLLLWPVCLRRMKGVTIRQEAVFALAGFCGICLYYLLENIALTYTLASNVGVMTSAGLLCGVCGGHGGDCPYQPPGGGMGDKSPGRCSGSGRGLCVGRLFRPDQEDQRLWLPGSSYNPQNLFLWHPVYDACPGVF